VPWSGRQERLYAIDSQRGLQLLSRPEPGQLRLQGSFVAPEGALWGLTTPVLEILQIDYTTSEQTSQ
jgi:hypothetical protein